MQLLAVSTPHDMSASETKKHRLCIIKNLLKRSLPSFCPSFAWIAVKCSFQKNNLKYSNSKRIPTYPWSIPQASPNPQMKKILHKLLVKGLGYVPGVCWEILRVIHNSMHHLYTSTVFPTFQSLSLGPFASGSATGPKNPRPRFPLPRVGHRIMVKSLEKNEILASWWFQPI